MKVATLFNEEVLQDGNSLFNRTQPEVTLGVFRWRDQVNGLKLYLSHKTPDWEPAFPLGSTALD